MVFYINDECGHTFAMQEDTFGMCNGTLVMTGLKYRFDNNELTCFMDELKCNAVNYKLWNPSCLFRVNPYGPFFSDLHDS